MKNKKYKPRLSLYAAVTALAMGAIWMSGNNKTSEMASQPLVTRISYEDSGDASSGVNPGTLAGTESPADSEKDVVQLPHTDAVRNEETGDPVPDEAYISDVPVLSQKDIAPTGCELVSAQMVLEFYGVDESFDDLAENLHCEYPVVIDGYIHAPHPEGTFIGSPYNSESYGCYAPAIVSVMNKFLPSGKLAVNTSGLELSALAEQYIPAGQPLLVWATIDMVETYPYGGWYLLDENGAATDEWFDWMVHEHCLVLVGYDEDSYIFHDPHEDNGEISYPRDVVEARYNAMGKYSIVVEMY